MLHIIKHKNFRFIESYLDVKQTNNKLSRHQKYKTDSVNNSTKSTRKKMN